MRDSGAGRVAELEREVAALSTELQALRASAAAAPAAAASAAAPVSAAPVIAVAPAAAAAIVPARAAMADAATDAEEPQEYEGELPTAEKLRVLGEFYTELDAEGHLVKAQSTRRRLEIERLTEENRELSTQLEGLGAVYSDVEAELRSCRTRYSRDLGVTKQRGRELEREVAALRASLEATTAAAAINAAAPPTSTERALPSFVAAAPR